MLTLNDDHEGLRKKLELLGYTGLRETDESLIQAFVAVQLTLQSFDLSKDAQGAVLDLLSTTGTEALKIAPEGEWRDFDYGNVQEGDFVRVKVDAYDSETGAKHNGLVGILESMRSGIATVRYLGLASNNKMRHPKEQLDSLKGVYNRIPTRKK